MPLSRLAKARSKTSVVEPNETKREERPPRYSIADLQSRRVVTTQRQLLRRQFSDQSTEALRCGTLFDGSIPHLTKASSSSVLNQPIDSPSSPPATPEASADVARPLGSPTDKLDVEHAIDLLQQLKKTASPEELVALHRALLPVKEVSPIYSPQSGSGEDSPFSAAVPPERRRSVLPPGLATRNGLTEDVLRKPGSNATVRAASRERREMWVHGSQPGAGSKPDYTKDPSSTRPETPSEQPNTGTYHPGTLRITNGAASPEPGVISKIAATGEGVADQDTSVAANVGKVQHSERPRPSGPRHSHRNSRAIEESEHESAGIQRSRSASISKPSAEMGRKSLDQPNSLPNSPHKARFKQRWSHRAAHLPSQSMVDADTALDGKAAQMELFKRLSSVPDVETDEANQEESHAGAISKLTSESMPAADNNRAWMPWSAEQLASSLPDHVDIAPPRRPLNKVDSDYQSDVASWQQSQLVLRSASQLDEPSALARTEPRTHGREQGVHRTGTGGLVLPEHAGKYSNGEALGGPHMEPHLTRTDRGRSSPLSFLRRNKGMRGSVSSMNDVVGNSLRPQSSPLSGSDTDSGKHSKRLQKRAPKSSRSQRTLEGCMRPSIDERDGSPAREEMRQLRSPRSDLLLASGETTRTSTPDTLGESSHRFRLRGKSFGRSRSHTNALAPNQDIVLQTPSFRNRVKRSISSSGPPPVIPEETRGTNCLSSTGTEHQHTNRPTSDFQTVARALASHPPYEFSEKNRSVALPKFVHSRQQSHQENNQSQSVPHPPFAELPPNEHVPTAATPAPLEGNDRVIPIGAHGAVEDLFPGWQSRPAATPSPASTPSPTFLQVRQPHRPRSPLSLSSVPPLPDLPSDIESKLSRADQMVAKRMMNSPRNSPRNSPLPSMRSENTLSSLARKDASKPASPQKSAGEIGSPQPTRGNRFSIDGSIPLPEVDGRSQPTSPTHDSQHPGWPGWQKQADLWRQRKAELGHAMNNSLDMSGKIVVGGEQSPSSPKIVVSRYITPLGANDTHVQYPNTAEKLAESYAHLLSDDWSDQHDAQRTGSVDSTAPSTTPSSDGKVAKLDVSWTGSVASSASSNASATGSPNPFTDKPATTIAERPFTPYRAADAVRAERSRALSRARRTCDIPPGSVAPGSFYIAEPHNTSMPQLRDATVLDRYSGGLGYGWDRSTGFGGSAGTLSTDNVNRKSVKMSEDFGIDLSDVPVFLRKTNTANV